MSTTVLLPWSVVTAVDEYNNSFKGCSIACEQISFWLSHEKIPIKPRSPFKIVDFKIVEVRMYVIVILADVLCVHFVINFRLFCVFTPLLFEKISAKITERFKKGRNHQPLVLQCSPTYSLFLKITC